MVPPLTTLLHRLGCSLADCVSCGMSLYLDCFSGASGDMILGALIALRSSRLAGSPASRPAATRGPAAWHGSICVEARSGGLPGALRS